MSQITLINSFAVPHGSEDAFVDLWSEVNRYMRRQPGYLRHTLHRAVTPGPFQFVNVAVWESREQFDAAHDEGFRQLVSKPEWKQFPSTPVLFEVVSTGNVADTANA